MVTIDQLTNALELLSNARIHIDYFAYKKIWGDRLGAHIWYQEGNDLIRIWKSGLSPTEKKQFLNHLVNNYDVQKKEENNIHHLIDDNFVRD